MSTSRKAGIAGPIVPAVYPTVATVKESQLQADAEVRGYRLGHTLGYAAGLQQASAEAARRRSELDAEQDALIAELRLNVSGEIAALEAASAALDARTKPVLAEAEQALMTCALMLAEAVLGRELDDGETSSRAVLTRVLAGRDESVAPRVRLNPQDLASIGEDVAGIERLDLVADPSISRGDAVAEYPHGFLDARISTALDRARQALLGRKQ